MHITATCPACQSQYQVDPSLRGKRMRCPNTICRSVFEVTDGTPVAEPAPVVAPPTPIATPAKPVVETPKWAAPPPVRAAAIASPLQPAVDDFDFPGDDDVGAERVAVPATSGRVGDPSHNGAAASIPKKKSRRPLVFLAVAAVAVAVVAVVVVRHLAEQKRLAEATLLSKANDLYQARKYKEATQVYQKLQRDYPDSPDAAAYRFLATLSELRGEIAEANDAAAHADARRHAGEFLDAFQDAPRFAAHVREFFDSVLDLTQRSFNALDESSDRAALESAIELWNRVRPLVADAANHDAKFQKDATTLRAQLDQRDRRNELIRAIEAAPPSAASWAEMRRRTAAANLAAHPAIANATKSLRDRWLATLVFVKPGEPPRAAARDPFEIVPLVANSRTLQPARGGDPIVTLAPSGVLYGVDPKKGSLLWLKRLGIDSRFAPVRPTEGVVVAASNDFKDVAALDAATGKDVWRQPLSAAVAASPFLAGGRLLVPLITGRVEIFDPVNGRREGSLQLDQPLATAGTPHPGTSLVSLPGIAHCVYVFDLASHTCVAVVDSDHVAGSLVGPPIVVSAGEKRASIVLPLAEPGPRVRFRPISFSSGAGQARPEKDFVVNGTVSTPPWVDAESIVLATDEGKLHRIGIRLPGNNDPLLFKLTPTEKALDVPPAGPAARGQVVHADAENVWATSAGRLQRLEDSFSAKTGPTLKTRWPSSTPLGDPLQPATVHRDADGTVLFLTTHDGASTLLSAVDAETGKILWQSQLGSIPRGDPLVLGDRVLWDDGAILFRGGLTPQWDKLPSLSGTAVGHAIRSVLLPADKKCVRVAWSPEQPKVSFLEFDVDAPTLPPTRDVKLPSPLALPPILLDGALIAPLKSGLLVRIDLATAAVTPGPDWRAVENSLPHLVRVKPDRFVVARGNGLVAYEWGKTWKEAGRFQPSDRVVTGRPFLVGDKLVVADTGGTLLLFDDRVQPIGRKDWSLGGKITAGPFAIGDKFAMVVDGKRLLAVDPARDGILWDVAFLSDVAVAPRLVGDRLVVADVGGNFWTLDPATGANLTPGDEPAVSSRANLAPAAGPVVLPDGRLFVLWSDGTAGIVAIP